MDTDITAATAETDKAEEQRVKDEVTSFDHFPISDDIRVALTEMGYTKPTGVQQACIGPCLSGRDVIVQSKTGSGKTAAFGIPCVEATDSAKATSKRPFTIVLTPTRELANQVAAELRALGKTKGGTVLAIYGGVSVGSQARVLEEGVGIVVATPGRLLDHIRRGNLDLGAIERVVLDEADEMLSMGFWDDVTDIIKKCPKNSQIMLFSATLPYQIAAAAKEHLKNPERIDLSGDIITVEGIENNIVHVVPDIPKPRQLLYLLEIHKPRNAIVFCNTRNETEMIAKYLTQSGFIADAICGTIKQRDRDRVMDGIKSGKISFMVATDVASRGVDISNLSHVINYSLPNFTEVYVHRVGRTGRAGKSGVAISLVDGKGMGTFSQLEKEYGITFTELTLPTAKEVLAVRSKRIMKDLIDRAAVSEVGQHLGVAKEIVKSEDNAQIIAFLLKQYFASQVGAQRLSVEEEPIRLSVEPSHSHATSTTEQDEGEAPKKKRRRRRKKKSANGATTGVMETIDASALLAGDSKAQDNSRPQATAPVAKQTTSIEEAAPVDVPEGSGCVRVNIGFDDGFRGRGAVAKKIAALAGVNDGVVQEVQSKRGFSMLIAPSDVVELLVERCDGAQIGRKVIEMKIQ